MCRDPGTIKGRANCSENPENRDTEGPCRPVGRSQLTGNSAGEGTGCPSNYEEKQRGGGRSPDGNSNSQKVMMVMGQGEISTDWMFGEIKELWFWVFQG